MCAVNRVTDLRVCVHIAINKCLHNCAHSPAQNTRVRAMIAAVCSSIICILHQWNCKRKSKWGCAGDEEKRCFWLRKGSKSPPPPSLLCAYILRTHNPPPPSLRRNFPSPKLTAIYPAHSLNIFSLSLSVNSRYKSVCTFTFRPAGVYMYIYNIYKFTVRRIKSFN